MEKVQAVFDAQVGSAPEARAAREVLDCMRGLCNDAWKIEPPAPLELLAKQADDELV